MPAVGSSKYVVQAGWNHVPHLDEKTKKELLAATPPHMRAARSEGAPSLGSGAIYPVPLEDLLVNPVKIPDFWPRAYGFDVGWNRTAALWGALDRTSDVLYLYTEHYRGRAEPSTHATAIRARGDWIPGAIDPASRTSGQKDGEQLLVTYGELGLKLTPAVNAVEAGLYEVWTRLATGRIKVFRTLQYFPAEYRMYRRDENGKIVKKNDHVMDCLRYLVMTGLSIATVRPASNSINVPTAGGDRIAGY